MDFTPAFSSTWDAPLLNEMLLQLITYEDLLNISKTAESNSTTTVNVTDYEAEETIQIDDTQVGSTIELNDTDTVESTSQVGGYKMFEYTINIEDTNEENTEMEGSLTSVEESRSASNISLKYFAGCPVHNHHTDSDSVCPDNPPCSCLVEC